jgi:hypothetical protein
MQHKQPFKVGGSRACVDPSLAQFINRERSTQLTSDLHATTAEHNPRAVQNAINADQCAGLGMVAHGPEGTTQCVKGETRGAPGWSASMQQAATPRSRRNATRTALVLAPRRCSTYLSWCCYLGGTLFPHTIRAREEALERSAPGGTTQGATSLSSAVKP